MLVAYHIKLILIIYLGDEETLPHEEKKEYVANERLFFLFLFYFLRTKDDVARDMDNTKLLPSAKTP